MIRKRMIMGKEKPAKEFHEERRRKLRLLMVADTFLPKRDGVMKFISEMLPRFSDEYDITLLVPDYGARISTFCGAKIIAMPETNHSRNKTERATPSHRWTKISKRLSSAVGCGTARGSLAEAARREY